MTPGGPRVGSALAVEIERLHPASFGWALGCCRGDREEASEALQAAYLKVLEGRARFDGRSSLKTWLFAVVRRTAAERRRRRWLRGLALGRWAAERPAPVPTADPESLLGRSEGSRALVDALSTLSPRQREVLHLVFYQELTLEDAARILRVSGGTARRHYERGKDRLRRKLAGEGGG